MLDRITPPQIHEIDAVSFLTAEVSRFPNGARLHKMLNTAQPVVRLEVVVKAGKWHETSPGTSFLLSKMLMEGTSTYSAKQLADVIAYYGASMDCQHGYDRMTLTLYCLAKYLPDLLPIVQEVLSSPTFPQEEFTLLQQRTIQNISVEKQKNSYLATERFTSNIFGSGHAYNSGLSEEAIANLSIENLRQFYVQHFLLETAEVFVCGDISNESNVLLENIFRGRSREIKRIDLEPLALNPGPREDYIEIPNSLQSSVRIGCNWPKVDHPDHHKLTLLNKVLGGYFGSRLMKNIREDKGFTYGIYSTSAPKENSNIFFIGTDVNYQNTQQTLDEIRKELKLLQTELIPYKELETVKRYTVGKFLGDINTIFEQCDRYKHLILHNLPHDHYTQFLLAVQSATDEELMALANLYWDIPTMFEVVVGRKGE
jgi:zinc protease